MISVEIKGAREASGKFASLADRKLAAHLYERAGLLAAEVEKRYREAAPKSSLGNQGSGDSRPTRFADSIRGVAMPSEHGFEISVETSQGDLAKWLNEGTAPHPIDARNVSVLANRDTGEIFGPHVDHPGSHKHDGWQDRVGEEVKLLAHEEGNKIGHYVSTSLESRI